jgi:TolA-binding protein
MVDESDNIRLSEQLESLKDMLTKSNQTTDRVLWIISDPDTGLVRRVGDIGKVTSDTVKEQTALTTQVKQLTESLKQLQQQQNDVVKTQDTHDDNIKALLKVNSDAAEAKKPFIAIAYGILEKLLWIAAIGVIGWLGVLVSQGR